MSSFEKKLRSPRERSGPDGGAGGGESSTERSAPVRTPPPREPRSSAPKPYKPPKNLGWKILKWCLIGGFVALVLGVGGLATLFYVHGRDLPRLDNVGQYDPPTVTRIYARGGELIAELAEDEGFRSVLPMARMPKHVIDCVLAAEDADFRSHEGLDYLGMFRAFLVNLMHGTFKQGGSTITQQVVKTMILTSEKTLSRKVKEMILARRLEQKLSKDEILLLYLNQIYFGHRRNGIEEAARFYFGKSAEKISLGEAAVLAGLIKSPGRFSPRLHPDASKARQREVLTSLQRASEAGKLSRAYSAAEVKAAMDAPIVVWQPREQWVGTAPYYADLVRQRVQQKLGEKAFFRKNLRIETSCDVHLQAAAERSLRKGLLKLDRGKGYRGAEEKLAAGDIPAFRKKVAKEMGGEVVAGEVYRAVVLEAGAATAKVGVGNLDALLPLKEVKWARAAGTRGRAPAKVSEVVAVGDVIRARIVSLGSERGRNAGQLIVALEQEPQVQGAIVVLDPRTRDVVALVGGYGFGKSPFNRAVKAQRQPGSSFKPIVYSAALRTKRYTPSTIVLDSPAVYGPIFSRHAYRPQNYDRQFRGEVRLRTALGQSLNLVAVKVADDIGIEAVREEALLLGIESPISKNLAVALGADSVTPMELANAYAVFASGGVLETPRVVRRATTGDGRSADAALPPSRRQVMSPEQAYLMTSMLRAPVEDPNGTAKRAARLGHLVAGKTGTTNGNRDAWFVGFTPELLAAVWIGNDDRAPLGRNATGGHFALPVWLDFMTVAMAGRPRSEFPRPGGIELARIDPRTGLVAAPGQVNALEEVYWQGTAPRDIAPQPGAATTPDTLLLDDYGAAAPQAGLPGAVPLGGGTGVPLPPPSAAPAPFATPPPAAASPPTSPPPAAPPSPAASSPRAAPPSAAPWPSAGH